MHPLGLFYTVSGEVFHRFFHRLVENFLILKVKL
jgi:hypothetical protein